MIGLHAGRRNSECNGSTLSKIVNAVCDHDHVPLAMNRIPCLDPVLRSLPDSPDENNFLL